jgi:predicted nucleic acid-binding protein
VPETFIVDCSVATKWVFDEPGRDAALTWLDRRASGEVSLVSPDLLLCEFASLIIRRNRRNHISAAQANQAFDLMVKISPKLVATGPRVLRAVQLSLHHRLSLWDSIYLALGVEYFSTVITADKRLFRGAVKSGFDVLLVG